MKGVLSLVSQGKQGKKIQVYTHTSIHLPTYSFPRQGDENQILRKTKDLAFSPLHSWRMLLKAKECRLSSPTKSWHDPASQNPPVL